MPRTVTVPAPVLTADEFMQLPSANHCELVRGRIVALTPPGAEHGSVVARVVRLIGDHVDEYDLGDVSCGDTGYRIATDPDTVRGPDIGFVSRQRIPASGLPRAYWDLAPELAVEVVSPGDRWTDVEAKTRDWLDAGTREVWLVDPTRREVRIVASEGTRVFGPGAGLESRVLPELRVPVDAMFGR